MCYRAGMTAVTERLLSVSKRSADPSIPVGFGKGEVCVAGHDAVTARAFHQRRTLEDQGEDQEKCH